jgi:hypothetical protein
MAVPWKDPTPASCHGDCRANVGAGCRESKAGLGKGGLLMNST